MITKLYQNIAAGLKKIRPCTIYQEDVPQNFKTPAFLIIFYDQNPKRGINGCLNNRVRVDVAYFPESKTDPQEACWSVGEDLIREFLIEDVKVKNRNLKITDNVLHFMFDVDYREYLETDETKMQNMSQQTEMKEE